MWVAIREVGQVMSLRWSWLTSEIVGGAAGWLLWGRIQARSERIRRQKRVQEEFEAYARLDVRLASGQGMAELAGRVARVIAEKGRFSRAAMLMPDAQGRLEVAGSVGFDDETIHLLEMQLLEVWDTGEHGGQARARRGGADTGVRVGTQSFGVALGSAQTEREHRQAIVVPLWSTGGRLLGALAVGADGLLGIRRSVLARALEPLESVLAARVARAIENAALAERLMRAEKLSGLGMMAGGMAHALNSPLTAVLGFAELIANTTGESRVKMDAEIVVREALRMRQTLEAMMEFWKPSVDKNARVSMMELVRELAAECGEKLEQRGVRLVIEAGDDGPPVRGDRLRLRQVLEHLLNNAAQALGEGGPPPDNQGERVIRVSVGHESHALHLVVSDTGPGFPDTARVFDPFDTMGAGLSICYGIVHEHGGEISAFNMHPHGAAVAIELPLGTVMPEKLKSGTAVAVAYRLMHDDRRT